MNIKQLKERMSEISEQMQEICSEISAKPSSRFFLKGKTLSVRGINVMQEICMTLEDQIDPPSFMENGEWVLETTPTHFLAWDCQKVTQVRIDLSVSPYINMESLY